MKTIFAIIISTLVLAVSTGQAAAGDLTDAIYNYNVDLAAVVAKTNKTSVKIRDEAGRTALFEAANRGYSDIAKYLVDNGADVKTKDSFGDTPLHAAASNPFRRYSSLDMVKFFIDKGADVTAKNENGETPIYMPVLNCDGVSYMMVEFLIKNGADVNAKDNAGNTPLHMAAGNGNFDCVQLLYDKGANLKLKNLDGKTASDLARELGHTELADAIDEAMEKK